MFLFIGMERAGGAVAVDLRRLSVKIRQIQNFAARVENAISCIF